MVTTEGALMVDAEVEEKAKERTVVALVVDPEEALLAETGEEASEEKAKEETVVETEMPFVVESKETSLAEVGEKASEVDTEDE